MIRAFIFWLIVAPCSLAFLLGFLASIAQTWANKVADQQQTGTSS